MSSGVGGGLSRRDNLQQTIGTVLEAVQQHNAQQRAAGAAETAVPSHDATGRTILPGGASSTTGSTGNQPSSARNRTSQLLATSPTQLADYLQRMGSNLQNAMQASPLNGASHGRSPYTVLGPVDPPASTSRASFESVDDDLPDYAQAGQGGTNGTLTSYRHSLSSNKMELVLESVGTKGFPVYVENLSPTVKGVVRLRASGEDLLSVNELRIRVKGMSFLVPDDAASADGLGDRLSDYGAQASNAR